MALVDQLRKMVEEYWNDVKKNDHFNRSLLNGTAKQEMGNHFLVNVRYLVQHTPIHLKKAAQEAEKRGHSKLAIFFRTKLKEERGHDKWADADIARLNGKDIHHMDSRIDPSTLCLIKHIEKTISTDPHLYLSYIFFAEYLCVVCGDEMATGWQKCGFPADSITVVANHAELDKEHVNEWVQISRELIDEANYANALLETVERTVEIHREFYKSCGRATHAAA